MPCYLERHDRTAQPCQLGMVLPLSSIDMDASGELCSR
jgi:hypothetical protein